LDRSGCGRAGVPRVPALPGDPTPTGPVSRAADRTASDRHHVVEPRAGRLLAVHDKMAAAVRPVRGGRPSGGAGVIEQWVLCENCRKTRQVMGRQEADEWLRTHLCESERNGGGEGVSEPVELSVPVHLILSCDPDSGEVQKVTIMPHLDASFAVWDSHGND